MRLQSFCLLSVGKYDIIKQGDTMKTNYNGLWKLLIDRGLKKKDLQHMAGLSSSSIAKLSKNENVTTDILVRICYALQCNIADIVEIDRMDEHEQKDD